MTKTREQNKRNSKTENVEKEQPSASLVRMLPFQGHVNTSFSQAELVGLSIYVQRKHVLFELD